MPLRTAAFRPAWWLPSPHLQTLWPILWRGAPPLPLRRERLELPDGDFLDLDWTPGAAGPRVLILHGLQGSARSRYARGLLSAVHARGGRAAVLHFRGCSGEPNRLARSYHSGDTGDLAFVVAQLLLREPRDPLAVAGFSLGGNVLLKWLGETGAAAPVRRAAAVSVPFRLERAAARLEHGFSRLYQWWLLRSLRASMESKRALGRLPERVPPLETLRSFRAFDEHVTAPLHGFRGADHYYHASSSRAYLPAIRVPTLIVQALDDPFLYPDAIPTTAELSSTTTLELSARGGHVGFVSGPAPHRAWFWLDQRLTEFLLPPAPPASTPSPGAHAPGAAPE